MIPPGVGESAREDAPLMTASAVGHRWRRKTVIQVIEGAVGSRWAAYDAPIEPRGQSLHWAIGVPLQTGGVVLKEKTKFLENKIN